MPAPVVLLHGFAGTGRSWDPVREHLPAGLDVRAPDVRGHGTRASARPISFADCAQDVVAELEPDRPAVVAGYSMGGRLALHAALAAPERFAHLVLVATTAGIEDPTERRARVAADAALAEWAQDATPEQFADRWQALPLFAGTPPAAAARWREDLLRNDPRHLAEVLRTIGTGHMDPPLWDRLGALDVPATVVAGERDAKFVALAERLSRALPRARLVLVPGAGHGLPREAPQPLARLLAAGAG
ncbi:alpha/beta fold hydrolase [Conexibacter sp. SYSU D00693]|uniref:alpha/beta fold hydrolase n=1 Tax=Conexibacter sp. SYSU D00693 TaxID=2812560 RepID=UPI00196AD8CB|nr:alpha/beta fold hydrolase [Conexibacter sp. SYSU D00693]